jgi:DNA-binding GntR family transcriptional regulator
MAVMTSLPLVLATPPPANPAAQRLTVSERVYYQLKRMIARGELDAGAALVIRDLAGKLKVSRTPVVEAIRRLERDGLVAVASKWGATVKEWSWDEIVEAFHIRAALEGEAVQQFVLRATPEDKQRLVELNDQFNHYASRDDRVRCDETDVELHLHIARATRFPRLYELIENSNIEQTAIWGATVKGARGRDSVDCRCLNVGVHDPLVRALLGEDPEAARIELLKDIKRSLELISEWRKAEEDSAVNQ